MALQVVILAAGQGKRMKSSLPKVLHHLAGMPLLEHIINTASTLSEEPPMVVYGHQGEKIKKAMTHKKVIWIEQAEQRGTAHALLQAIDKIKDNDQVLVLYGDTPLISAKTLEKLIDQIKPAELGLLTAELTSPRDYGRIIREDGKITRIVEEKDATAHQLKIKEINSGIYYVKANYLKKWLPRLANHNAQGEYYLTDIVHLAAKDNIPIQSLMIENHQEILGVNDKIQLSHLERCYQYNMAKKFMEEGVTVLDPHRFDVRGEVIMGKEVVIDINVILIGKVILGDRTVIGPNTILRDCTLEEEVEVRANSIIEESIVGARSTIGPYARIRPESRLSEDVHIGNFVEIKKSDIGAKTKINHLSYIGDSIVGKKVNIGAGVITCNYDGKDKHKTIIGDRAFIGSNSQLVAPVHIGEGALIGAGSTITKNAPAQQLTLSRSPQVSIQRKSTMDDAN